MMRYNLFPAVAIGGASLFAVNHHAVTAAIQAPKCVVAYVRGADILTQLPAYLRADSALTAEKASYQLELQKLGAALDSAASDYQEKSTLMTPTAKNAELSKLQQQRQALDQRNTELQQQAMAQQQSLMQPIEAQVTDAIDHVRGQVGCSMILDASSQAGVILSADKSLDLTDRVTAQLKTEGAAAPATTPPPAPTGVKPPAPHKP